jgi:hypothetical protein
MSTERTLSYLRGSEPAHYVALVGLITLSGGDLTLHFDGLTPVVTSARGASSAELGGELASRLRAQTQTGPGHALTRVGMGSSTPALSLFDDQVDSEWAGASTVEWSTLVGFGSPDTVKARSHTLFFGSGAVHMGSVLGKLWNAGADDLEAFLAQDFEEILDGEPAASIRQRAILRFSATGNDSKQRYGGADGFVDVALEALAVRVFDTLSPVKDTAFVARTASHRPVFRWTLNQSPASAGTLTAMHRLDRPPVGLRSFQTELLTVNKYARFGSTTELVRT